MNIDVVKKKRPADKEDRPYCSMRLVTGPEITAQHNVRYHVSLMASSDEYQGRDEW